MAMMLMLMVLRKMIVDGYDVDGDEEDDGWW
jgi:hypothetical protein